MAKTDQPLCSIPRQADVAFTICASFVLRKNWWISQKQKFKSVLLWPLEKLEVTAPERSANKLGYIHLMVHAAGLPQKFGQEVPPVFRSIFRIR